MPYDCGQDYFQLISAMHTNTFIQTNKFSDALRLLTRYVWINIRSAYNHTHPNQHILACPRTADKILYNWYLSCTQAHSSKPTHPRMPYDCGQDYFQWICALHTSTPVQTNTFSDALGLLTRYVSINICTAHKHTHPNQHILGCPTTADKITFNYYPHCTQAHSSKPTRSRMPYDCWQNVFN